MKLWWPQIAATFRDGSFIELKSDKPEDAETVRAKQPHYIRCIADITCPRFIVEVEDQNEDFELGDPRQLVYKPLPFDIFYIEIQINNSELANSEPYRVCYYVFKQAGAIRIASFLAFKEGNQVMLNSHSIDLWDDGEIGCAKYAAPAFWWYVWFLPQLYSERTEREAIRPKELWKTNAKLPLKERQFSYTVIRAPVIRDKYGKPLLDATGQPRRAHLVRGYEWGRFTRDPEQRRWIEPHWRGDETLGVLDRSHYLVKT